MAIIKREKLDGWERVVKCDAKGKFSVNTPPAVVELLGVKELTGSSMADVLKELSDKMEQAANVTTVKSRWIYIKASYYGKPLQFGFTAGVETRHRAMNGEKDIVSVRLAENEGHDPPDPTKPIAWDQPPTQWQKEPWARTFYPPSWFAGIDQWQLKGLDYSPDLDPMSDAHRHHRDTTVFKLPWAPELEARCVQIRTALDLVHDRLQAIVSKPVTHLLGPQPLALT